LRALVSLEIKNHTNPPLRPLLASDGELPRTTLPSETRRRQAQRRLVLGLCFKSLCAPKTVEAPRHSHCQRTASQAKTLSRYVQSSLTPPPFPPCNRPGRLKAGGCIKLSCQSCSGEAMDCCRAESPRGRPLKVRQLAFPSTVQEDLLRHISFRFCTLARSAVPR
jgi:hypothetical protein